MRDAYYHIHIHPHSRKIYHVPDATYQFETLYFHLCMAPMKFTKRGQRGQTHGSGLGYKNPPLTRWLVDHGKIDTHIPPTNPWPTCPTLRECQRHSREIGKANNKPMHWWLHTWVRTIPLPCFHFVSYQYDLHLGRSHPLKRHPKLWSTRWDSNFSGH